MAICAKELFDEHVEIRLVNEAQFEEWKPRKLLAQ
jgi:hypothetical protein